MNVSRHGPELCPIVYFGNDWFAENRTSAHHIARRLAGRFPLLYIETPGLRAPQASGRDLRKLVVKLRQALAHPRQLGPQMWHLTVPQVPFRALPGVGALNRWFGGWQLKRALATLGWRRYLAWFTVPHAGLALDALRPRLAVYYCVDDYSALPGVDAASVRAMDEALSRRADLVFAVSSKLVERHSAFNSHVVYSPHGVDIELFGRVGSTAPAPEVASLPKPVIGYFGVVDGRVDVDLISALAAARPGWTFLLLGHCDERLRSRMDHPNIVFHGPVPYEALPAWAAAFDVCLMPYRAGDFARHANPLKLREYLATGKPVVSVAMPAAAGLAQHLYIAEGCQGFVEAIEQALHEDLRRRDVRLTAAREFDSWDDRLETILGAVDKRLGEVCPPESVV